MVERLDEERLETLRAWGAGLSTNARDELRAAGKAILMLVDEIDRLEADLWNGRAATKQAEGAAAAAREAAASAAAAGAVVGVGQAPAAPVEEPALPAMPVAAESPPPPQRAERERLSPTVEPSQVLALTLSERIARGRPPSSETA